jgi:membrane protein DedA with SNARE-associated domain
MKNFLKALISAIFVFLIVVFIGILIVIFVHFTPTIILIPLVSIIVIASFTYIFYKDLKNEKNRNKQ